MIKMAVNRGKQFEDVIRKSFEKVPDVSIDRIHDQTNGYLGSKNACDFIVYKKPYEYYLECKSVHGNTLPFANITDNQWKSLLEKSKIDGVVAGVICWWVDKDVTKFISIKELDTFRSYFPESKSIKYNTDLGFEIFGKKKRVFFDYSMEEFFKEIENEYL